jgi:hypothetical protein
MRCVEERKKMKERGSEVGRIEIVIGTCVCCFVLCRSLKSACCRTRLGKGGREKKA